MNRQLTVAEHANTARLRTHLRLRLLELWTLPLRSTHEGTGLPVWLLISLVMDAYERVEMGKAG